MKNYDSKTDTVTYRNHKIKGIVLRTYARQNNLPKHYNLYDIASHMLSPIYYEKDSIMRFASSEGI